jgi:predicted Zn-dependent protease
MALNNLAWLLREREPQRALALAREAHRRSPDNPRFADTYGELLLRTGSPEAAVAVLEPAWQQSDDPGIAVKHARALADGARAADARRVLRSLAGREFPERQEADALLERIGR